MSYKLKMETIITTSTMEVKGISSMTHEKGITLQFYNNNLDQQSIHLPAGFLIEEVKIMKDIQEAEKEINKREAEQQEVTEVEGGSL